MKEKIEGGRGEREEKRKEGKRERKEERRRRKKRGKGRKEAQGTNISERGNRGME